MNNFLEKNVENIQWCKISVGTLKNDFEETLKKLMENFGIFSWKFCANFHLVELPLLLLLLE